MSNCPQLSIPPHLHLTWPSDQSDHSVSHPCLQVGPDLTITAPVAASHDPWSLSQDGNFLCYKGLLYIPDDQDIRLDILHSHPNPIWRDTPASPRPSRIFVGSSIGLKWLPSSLITFTRVRSAAIARPCITSHLALTSSSQLGNDLGTQS